MIGCLSFLAPEFFTEDGCGKEVDIWACGVLLFFMLFHEYPFNFPNKQEESCLGEFKEKCLPSFEFSKVIVELKNPGYLKSTKNL